MEPAIDVVGLRKSYGTGMVLHDLDLRVPGGIYALLGPNGAGKTTLVHILTTLIRADGGTASVLGVPVSDRRRLRRLIGVTGQFAAVDELLTPVENLTLVGRLLGLRPPAARRRARHLIDSFDLGASAAKPVKALSGGTLRRVDLAMSLVMPAPVLFLDEPTTGLDPASRRRLWADIRALADGGTCVFLTTQYLEEAEALADRIGVLADGRIVAEGSASELAAIAGSERAVLVGADGEEVRTLPTDGTVAGLAATLSELAAEHGDLRVELRRPTLEDAFTKLTETRPDREPEEALS